MERTQALEELRHELYTILGNYHRSLQQMELFDEKYKPGHTGKEPYVTVYAQTAIEIYGHALKHVDAILNGKST